MPRLRPVRLLNAAVTNDPNLKGMVPLSNRSQGAGDRSQNAKPGVPTASDAVMAEKTWCRLSNAGGGEGFAQLVEELRAKGAEDPEALAAWIGRKKHGAGKMAEMSKEGRSRDPRHQSSPEASTVRGILVVQRHFTQYPQDAVVQAMKAAQDAVLFLQSGAALLRGSPWTFSIGDVFSRLRLQGSACRALARWSPPRSPRNRPRLPGMILGSPRWTETNSSWL